MRTATIIALMTDVSGVRIVSFTRAMIEEVRTPLKRRSASKRRYISESYHLYFQFGSWQRT
jgi:hypothetical protein